MNRVNFWEEARRGAARHFGRRHYKAFLVIFIVEKCWPVLVGALLILAAAVAVLVLQHTHPTAVGWARYAPGALAALLVAVPLWLAWRRWGTTLGMYLPGTRPALTATLLGAVLALGAGALVLA